MGIRKEKLAMLESSIEKTASFLKTTIAREEAWTWNVFRKRSRYVDKEGRQYRAAFKNRKDIAVSVSSSRASRKMPLREKNVEFIFSGGRLYRKTDRQLVLEFLSSFFGRRQYKISFLEARGKKLPYRRWTRALIVDGGHYGEIEILKTFPLWQVRVRDSKDGVPYFCTQGYHYDFKFRASMDTEKELKAENLLIDYTEDETEDYTAFSFSAIKKAVYGFNSPNLRAFYSEEGLFPEMQHAIKLSVYANLAIAIINASVFVRVAERLQGNTWYTLAAGVLVFIRAPAEVFYMRKSLRISRHLPSAIVKDAVESDEFKELAEKKPIRGWRNFEKKLYDTVRKKENFTVLLERYGVVKTEINESLKQGNVEGVVTILKDELNFMPDEVNEIACYARHLEPIDVKAITSELSDSINVLVRQNIFKHNAELILRKYIEEIFPINLLNTTFSRTLKLLRDRIKQEERVPSKEEVSRLVSACKQQILPFRLMDILLFLSLYSVGYAVTFLRGLPDILVPAYYIFYGAAANVINAAVLRIGSQVNMQYIYRNLGSAPTISSAADAWNEYNSHIMRIWAVFSSLGLIIGISGKLLSSATHGISRYAVEFFALLIYLKGFREWYLFYTGLETKIKTEE